MAHRWITALVEPPTAIISTMALRMDSRVRIFRAVSPDRTISTIRSPLRRALRSRSLKNAGISAPPGRHMPSASAMQHMLLAVPMN